MEYFIYFGIINCLFIPLAIYYLWSKNGKFSFVETPLSYAGITHTKRHSVSLISLGVLFELLFVIYLLSRIDEISNAVLLIFLVFGFGGIFITALTPHGRPRLHRAGIRVMITAMTFWSFYLHYLLISFSPTIAYLGFTLSLITLIGIPYLYSYIKSKGLTELYFVAVVLSWNILMTFFLLNNNLPNLL